MKVNDFRNRVNQYVSRDSQPGNLCKAYVQNLVSEFGRLTLPTGPFKFSLYNDEDGELVCERGGKKDIVDEVNAKATLEMVGTFRDDLTIGGEDD
jgi:hypothetical protein